MTDTELPWPALLIILTPSMGIKEVNRAWQRFGISANALLTTTFTHWIHPDDLPQVEISLAHLQQQPKDPVTVETRWRDISGEYRWILWGIAKITEDTLRAVGLEASPQKYLEQRYRAIINGLQEGILLYDADGTITLCNPGAEKLLGKTAAELLGKTDWGNTLVKEDGSHLPDTAHPAQLTLQSKIPHHNTLGFYKPEGNLAWFNINAYPLRLYDTTHHDAAVLCFTDVSDSQYREEELQEKITLLSALFENQQIGVAIINEDGRFVRLNSTYCQLYGYRVEELIGQLFTILLAAPIRKEALSYHADFLAGKAESSGQWPRQHRQGQLINKQYWEDKLTLPDKRVFRITFVIPSLEKSTKNLSESVDLLHNEEWLQLLFTHSLVTTLCLDREGYVAFAKGPLLETLNWQEEDILGLPIWEVAHELRDLQSSWQRALGGEHFSRHVHYKGLYFDVKFIPWLKQEEWIGTLVVFHDVTENKMLKARLKSSLQELELLAPYSNVGLLYVEGQKITRVNSQATILLGYNQAELLQLPVSKLFQTEEDYQLFQTQWACHSGPATFSYFPWLSRKEGNLIHFKLTLRPLTAHGKSTWLLEEHPDLLELDKGPNLHTALWNSSPEALFLLDKQLGIKQANPASLEFTGYTSEELSALQVPMLNAGQQDEKFYQALNQSLIEQGHWEGQLWQRHKNQSLYRCDLKIQVYQTHKNSPIGYLAILSNRQTNRTSLLDPLTQLPTDNLFRQQLLRTQAVAQRYSKRFAILLVKLEKLPELNQQHGCLNIDLLLQGIAQNLRSSVRDSDSVARLSGSCFAVNLDEISKPQDAGLVAQMILFKLTQPFLIKDQKIQCPTSIGIVVSPEDGQEIDELVKLAQLAAQRAQQRGGGQCCFHNPHLEGYP